MHKKRMLLLLLLTSCSVNNNSSIVNNNIVVNNEISPSISSETIKRKNYTLIEDFQYDLSIDKKLSSFIADSPNYPTISAYQAKQRNYIVRSNCYFFGNFFSYKTDNAAYSFEKVGDTFELKRILFSVNEKTACTIAKNTYSTYTSDSLCLNETLINSLPHIFLFEYFSYPLCYMTPLEASINDCVENQIVKMAESSFKNYQCFNSFCSFDYTVTSTNERCNFQLYNIDADFNSYKIAFKKSIIQEIQQSITIPDEILKHLDF